MSTNSKTIKSINVSKLAPPDVTALAPNVKVKLHRQNLASNRKVGNCCTGNGVRDLMAIYAEKMFTTRLYSARCSTRTPLVASSCTTRPSSHLITLTPSNRVDRRATMPGQGARTAPPAPFTRRSPMAARRGTARTTAFRSAVVSSTSTSRRSGASVLAAGQRSAARRPSTSRTCHPARLTPTRPSWISCSILEESEQRW